MKPTFSKLIAFSLIFMTMSPLGYAKQDSCTNLPLNKVLKNLDKKIAYAEYDVSSKIEMNQYMREYFAGQKNVVLYSRLGRNTAAFSLAGTFVVFAASGMLAQALVGNVTRQGMLSFAFGESGAIASNSLGNAINFGVGIPVSTAVGTAIVAEMNNKSLSITPGNYVLSDNQITEMIENSNGVKAADVWKNIIEAQNDLSEKIENKLIQEQSSLLADLNNKSGLKARFEKVFGLKDLKELEIKALYSNEHLVLAKENQKFLKAMQVNIQRTCLIKN